MLQREILVTGAAGYVGSVLCRQLLAMGFRVRGLDVLLFGEGGLCEILDNPHFSFLKGDLCNADTRRRALADVHAVIHLAAIVGDPACKQFADEATALMDVASRALFEEAEAAGVELFVFASTCSNYGQMQEGTTLLHENSPLLPQSHYARLKVGFEEYLLARVPVSSVAVSILRFATAYGLSPRMRFDLTVNHFTRDLMLGKELLVFGQHQWRPYCHVADLARALTLPLTLPATQGCGIFNIGDSQENYSKAMIVDHVLQQVPQGKVAYGNQADRDTRDYRVDFSKAAQQLGFQITHRVPDGIQEIKEALASATFEDPFSNIYENC
jgi:nucleoside-diphosphate-sugar epimerase